MTKRNWADGVLGNTPLSAKRLNNLESDLEASLVALARDPAQLFAGPVTYDSNGAEISAVVKWPDGVDGTYSGVASETFPGTVSSYTISRIGPNVKTYTQPRVTRDAVTGKVTNRPPIVVTGESVEEYLYPDPVAPSDLDAALVAKITDTSSDTSAALDATYGPEAAGFEAKYATVTGVDTSLDAEQARADAEYRKKDSTIYIPYDHSWWSSAGTETEGFGPDSNGNQRRVWGLLLSGATPADAASNPGAHTTFRVPSGWNTVSVKILYVPTTATGGNAAWNGGIYNFSDGNSYNAGTGLASSATSVGTTAWVQRSHLSSTVLAVDYTKTQLLHIYRNALSGTDTYNDAVLFRGVEINWVS